MSLGMLQWEVSIQGHVSYGLQLQAIQMPTGVEASLQPLCVSFI